MPAVAAEDAFTILLKVTPVELVVVDSGTEQVTPVGDPCTPHASVIVPLKPFSALACTGFVAEPPSFTATLPTVVEMRLKSVVFSCKLFDEAVIPEESPVIWKVVVCRGVKPAVVLTVTTDGVPGMIVGGLAAQDIPAARFEQSTSITWLNPFCALNVTVKSFEVPTSIVWSVAGAADAVND